MDKSKFGYSVLEEFFNGLKIQLVDLLAAHPTPFPLVLETPRETSGTAFNPYRRGTAAARREALKKRNKQRSKKK